jgi:hypothetical protein
MDVKSEEYQYLELRSFWLRGLAHTLVPFAIPVFINASKDIIKKFEHLSILGHEEHGILPRTWSFLNLATITE